MKCVSIKKRQGVFPTRVVFLFLFPSLFFINQMSRVGDQKLFLSFDPSPHQRQIFTNGTLKQMKQVCPDHFINGAVVFRGLDFLRHHDWSHSDILQAVREVDDVIPSMPTRRPRMKLENEIVATAIKSPLVSAQTFSVWLNQNWEAPCRNLLLDWVMGTKLLPLDQIPLVEKPPEELPIIWLNPLLVIDLMAQPKKRPNQPEEKEKKRVCEMCPLSIQFENQIEKLKILKQLYDEDILVSAMNCFSPRFDHTGAKIFEQVVGRQCTKDEFEERFRISIYEHMEQEWEAEQRVYEKKKRSL